MKKVILDAGHGGSDTGCYSAAGDNESTYVLEMVKLVKDLLEPYVDVLLTREDNSFVSLRERVLLANTEECDLFVSMHTNSSYNTSAQGYEVFTSRGQTKADELALKLASRHVESFPAQRNRGIKEAGYYVLKFTKCPAALIEFGFFSNPAEAEWLQMPETKRRLARSVANGILDYCGVTETSQSPLTIEDRLDRIEKHLKLC
jgi:N-acetylmuramoyl-L-alanine amidase